MKKNNYINNNIKYESKVIIDNIDNINDENDNNDINNENISHYSNLFKNTSVNIVKKKNILSDKDDESQLISPSFRRNMGNEFITIDYEKNEGAENSKKIKKGINKVNNIKYYRPLYFSEKRVKVLLLIIKFFLMLIIIIFIGKRNIRFLKISQRLKV